MQRSSLSVLMVLATAACGPAMGSGGENTSADAEGAVTIATVTPAAPLITTLARPKPQVDACVNYDSITAAIGSRTVDCLGMIGPDAYAVNSKGRLIPRFQGCKQDAPAGSDKDMYGDILSLLSIQDRKDAPDAVRCIGGRYAAWLKTFQATGIKMCPLWKRMETLNAPTEQTIQALAGKQPKLPISKPESAQQLPHENYLMELQFPDGKRDERCKDAADCAQKCSAGFKGMWIEGEGTKALIDPAFWLLTFNFGSGTNPFMLAGYYHPMSFSGTIPGALYGHRNRKGEPCSRFVVDEHVLLNLQLDCIDPAVPTTCITVCMEPPLETAGTESKTPI